jgi:argininosuccinate synthase
MKKVVLAYSGGLDTSYCLKYLKRKGFEVHTVINTGFDEEELKAIEENELGSAKHANLTIVDKYYNKAIKYLIYGTS